MRGIRSIVLGVLVASGIALAPSAFARGHVSVGIGLPGLSVGWSDCRHCGHGWAGNYYSGGYYGGYYAPAYYSYSPAYYAPDYYGPSYYGAGYYAPSYYGHPRGSVYYYRDRPSHYYGRDGRHDSRDYGRRASYYDRGRDYRD